MPKKFVPPTTGSRRPHPTPAKRSASGPKPSSKSGGPRTGPKPPSR